MTSNVNRSDRVIRVILGFAVIIVGILLNSWWGALGLIFVVTGLVRWCPIYAAFGISTIRRKRHPGATA